MEGHQREGNEIQGDQVRPELPGYGNGPGRQRTHNALQCGRRAARPNGDRINQGLFRAFDPALEAGFRRPTTSNDHAMISASPAPMCVTWTTSSCHDSAPVAPAWLAAMGNVCVVPHQELATSDRAMAHVNQAAITITQTDLSPTLCGSASSAVARTMNSIRRDAEAWAKSHPDESNPTILPEPKQSPAPDR